MFACVIASFNEVTVSVCKVICTVIIKQKSNQKFSVFDILFNFNKFV